MTKWWYHQTHTETNVSNLYPCCVLATYIRVVYLFLMISVCRELEEMEAKHKFQLSDLEMRYVHTYVP